jgi:sarcosine oxidase, subunit beta
VAWPDVAIVGAGITGLTTAFHLAERGAGRIVVYERAGIASGASGMQPGGVRQQWGTRVNCTLARASLAFYREVGERLEARIELRFRACGYLFVAHEPATLERLRADVALQNQLGIPSRIVGAEEAEELVPGLAAGPILGGSWCDEDGYFDRPQAVVEAFAEAARARGVEIRHAEVAAIEPGPRFRLADGAVVDAGAVVVAAGADTAALVRPLGVDLPLEREQRSLFLSEPIRERLLEPLVVAHDLQFASKQLADGRVLAADLAAEREPVRQRAHVRRVVTELLPRLEFVTLPLVVGGAYDNTPDRQGIVDVVGGVVVAAGFDGHGFMLAPEVGRAAASLALGERVGGEVAELKADRFSSESIGAESRVI